MKSLIINCRTNESGGARAEGCAYQGSEMLVTFKDGGFSDSSYYIVVESERGVVLVNAVSATSYSSRSVSATIEFESSGLTTLLTNKKSELIRVHVADSDGNTLYSSLVTILAGTAAVEVAAGGGSSAPTAPETEAAAMSLTDRFAVGQLSGSVWNWGYKTLEALITFFEAQMTAFADIDHGHNADEITVAASPVNYDIGTSADDLETHLEGIDTKLGQARTHPSGDEPIYTDRTSGVQYRLFFNNGMLDHEIVP